MSDPVTNVEIEDVLSSIRRLVSDGDKARTRDPAPVVAEEPSIPELPAEGVLDAESSDEARPSKFVLTPAFMIVDNVAPQDAEEDEAEDTSMEVPEFHHHGGEDTIEDLAEDEVIDEQSDVEANDLVADAALVEGLVADEADDQSPKVEEKAANEPAKTPPSAPDLSGRASLVATIAELEAAVSRTNDDYELDGSEEETGETIAWPGSVNRNLDDVEDATTDDTAENDAAGETDKPQAYEPTTAKAPPEAQHDAPKTEPAASHPMDIDEDEYEDDDLDGLLDVGGVTIDEEALRELVADVVRQELTGALGERITRNVRKLVRREIYRILSSQDFD